MGTVSLPEEKSWQVTKNDYLQLDGKTWTNGLRNYANHNYKKVKFTCMVL